VRREFNRNSVHIIRPDARAQGPARAQAPTLAEGGLAGSNFSLEPARLARWMRQLRHPYGRSAVPLSKIESPKPEPRRLAAALRPLRRGHGQLTRVNSGVGRWHQAQRSRINEINSEDFFIN